MLQPLRYWSVSHPHGTRTLLQFSSLIVSPLLFTSLLSDSLYFRSSFGPSTSIYVTLSFSFHFCFCTSFSKILSNQKRSFLPSNFSIFSFKKLSHSKRREREFYGYNWKKEEEKISFLERKTHGIQSCKFIKWMLSFVTIYRFFVIKNFCNKIFSNKKISILQVRRL